MQDKLGTIEEYFGDGLGIDASTQDLLRETFTEPQTA
jgi:hypothetical protein